MSFFEIFILALIEGVTEFLPVSSTGHLIIASALMGIEEDPFVKSFNIIIQFGAILSVLVIYWRKFLPNLEFYKKIALAFLPAAVIGLLVKDHIDALLGSVVVVAWALIVGGMALIFFDRKFAVKNPKSIDDMKNLDCLKLGFIQCLAFIPGMSRSGATILGGLFLKMSRKDAAEFSFFLAVPTLAGATFIKSLKVVQHIEPGQVSTLLLGSFLAFVFAYAAIRVFIALVSRIGFFYFGLYRIAVGTTILVLFYMGLI